MKLLHMVTVNYEGWEKTDCRFQLQAQKKNRHKETAIHMLGCHVCNQVTIIITGISDIIVIHKQFCSRSN